MSSFMNGEDRILSLLCDKSTVGLSEEQQHELDRLLVKSGMTDESEYFESASAAFDLAASPHDLDVELPLELRDKILAGANEFFLGKDTAPSDPVLSSSTGSTELRRNDEHDAFSKTNSGWRTREILAWAVAVASFAFGVWIWNGQPVATGPASQTTSVAQVDSASDSVTADWSNVHSENVSGKVAWSDKLQRGYMTFENLPANDPSLEQYQLWIFDKDVTQAVPTDGGVFDIVEKDGVSTVFFQPTHPVAKGVQFAITIEPPGGVQKSDRKRLPVIATIPGTQALPAKASESQNRESVNAQPSRGDSDDGSVSLETQPTAN